MAYLSDCPPSSERMTGPQILGMLAKQRQFRAFLNGMEDIGFEIEEIIRYTEKSRRCVSYMFKGKEPDRDFDISIINYRKHPGRVKVSVYNNELIERGCMNDEEVIENIRTYLDETGIEIQI